MKRLLIILGLTIVTVAVVWAAAPTTLEDFHLAGTQPNQVTLEGPNRCHNCHGGYDPAVEPSTGWKGTMMAQAMRDPLFRAFVVIANQDAPESGDLCIRCHTPEGWLEGRSTPTDGSSLTTRDYEGITCDFCHKLVKPAAVGDNPYPGDADYLAGAYDADQKDLASLADIPPQSGNGMYIVSADKAKRGPFVDATARHQMFYSPFHQEAALCGTCHDVSNPVFSRQPDNTYLPNDFDLRTDSYNTYDMYPVERTYSEWLMSDYNSESGVYAPQFGGNKANVSTCQDCHMRDVTGVGCNKKGTAIRDDLPLHDLTGGNTFVPGLIAQLFPDDVDVDALQAGVVRATAMLQKAATMEVSYTETGSEVLLDVKITNETGHKLPSGYPEGRRIWLNVQAYDLSNNLIYESGAYDGATGVLTHDADAKIYEIKPGIDTVLGNILGMTAEPTFHFVLNNTVYKDNRIPARGFTNANYVTIQSPVVAYSYADGQYWDNTQYSLPVNTYRIEVTLKYQTTSKELIEFLRDENYTDDAGQIMYDLWNTNGKSAPVAMNSESIYIGTPPTFNSHVAYLYVSRTLSGKRTIGTASVTVTDQNGSPIEGATVTADYTGPTSGTVSGTTDATGQVVLTTRADRKGATDWCFTITDVVADGFIYDPTANVLTSVCETRAAVKENELSVPTDFALEQNYPNPFNPTTDISFSLSTATDVTLAIYNVNGQIVEIVHEGYLAAGKHSFRWNAENLASGVYLYRLTAGQFVDTKKMTLLK